MTIKKDVMAALKTCCFIRGCAVHQGFVFSFFVTHYYQVSPETVPRVLRQLRAENKIIGEEGFYDLAERI